jgi:hypothetical protein
MMGCQFEASSFNSFVDKATPAMFTNKQTLVSNIYCAHKEQKEIIKALETQG